MIGRCCLLLLAAAVVAQEAPQRAEVALVNGTATADEVEIYVTGAVRLVGSVVIHLEQLGENRSTVDVTADRVTVITTGEAGALAVSKLFAAGRVHIDAVTRDAAKRETVHVVSDCDRLSYLAKDEVVTLVGEGAEPVKATVTREVDASTDSGVEGAQKQTLLLTGRKEVRAYLREVSLDELVPAETKP